MIMMTLSFNLVVMMMMMMMMMMKMMMMMMMMLMMMMTTTMMMMPVPAIIWNSEHVLTIRKKTPSWSYLKYRVYLILCMLKTMILYHSLYQVILEFPCRNYKNDQKYNTHSHRFLCHYDDVILPVAHVTNMDWFNTSRMSNYMQIHHKV